jgi:hypothetical protein
MSFAKLFSTITESSLWGQSKDARLLFVSMLARADQNGFVEAAVTGLARMSNLTLAETQAALAELEAPDPYSKSPEQDGRRVMKCDRGWLLTNYDAYRNRRDDEARREYKARWIKERRAQSRNVDTCRHDVDSVDSRGHLYTQAEAEAEAEADTIDAVCIPGKQSAPMPMTRSWMDWKITIGRHRVFIDREGNAEGHWAELYSRTGWDEFTKAWEYCAGKTAKPGGKVFLGNMLEVIA